jgi:benzoate-CoA ligase family protein
LSAAQSPGHGRSPQNNVALQILDRQLASFRERPAFHLESGAVTYGDLQERVIRAAAVFHRAGLGYESRVILILDDGVDLVASLLALQRLGAVPVPLAASMSPQDYAFIFEDCRPAGAVVTPRHRDLLSGVADSWPGVRLWVTGKEDDGEPWRSFDRATDAAGVEQTIFSMSPDDVALIQYTSGSTGQPKGVVHLHRGVAALEEGFARRLALAPDDVCFSAAKMSFGYGLGNSVLFPLSAGASSVLVAEPVDPFRAFEVLARHRPSVFFAVPALYAGMLEVPRAAEADLSHLRLCVSAGEHLSARLFERWREAFGLEILDGIGATECLHIFISSPAGAIRPGSTGKVLPGYQARIVGEEGEELPPGEAGHLWIRGETNAARYWNRHDATRRQFQGPWVRTGDLFSRDEDGYFHFLGRSDDILKVAGLKVSPTEVEACLAHHEAVQECAVVARVDDEEITSIVAYVVLRAGWEAGRKLSREIKVFLRSELAAHKCPREVRFVASLPKTSTGKTARFKLREREEAQP